MIPFLIKHKNLILKLLLILIVFFVVCKFSSLVVGLITSLLAGWGVFKGKKETIEIEKREIDDYKDFLKKKKKEHEDNKKEAQELEKEMKEFLEELRRWQ